MRCPKLIRAIALPDYILELEYENSGKRMYDFKPNLCHVFYKELQNPAMFEKVFVSDGDIGWPTGQDFCPNTLYEKSVAIYTDKSSANSLFSEGICE